MSINLTDEIEVKTKKGKLGAAKQIFLEGDIQTVENEIQDINSRHNALNTKHESLSKIVQGIAVTGGASTAANVTYNKTNSGLNAENAQDAINELAKKKADKASVVQESGDSEELVMSQKAVSNKLNDLSSTITEIEEKANNASTDASNALTKAEEANNKVEDNKSTLNTIIPDISMLKEKVEYNKSALTTATSDISTLKKKVEDISATIPKVVSMSESAYDDLETKESDTYYMLTEE